MSLDSASSIQRLESALLGSLAHIANTTQDLLNADVVAVRVFGLEARAQGVHAAVARPGVAHLSSRALRQWITHDRPAIAELPTTPPRAEVYPHGDLLAYAGLNAAQTWFGALADHASVADSLTIVVPVSDRAYAVIIALQLAPSPAFTREHADALLALRPTAADVARSGLQCDLAGVGATRVSRTTAGALDTASAVDQLTRTERTVFDHLCRKLTEKEIAKQLHRSPHTVHVHVKNIYRKVGVNSRKQLLDRFGNAAN